MNEQVILIVLVFAVVACIGFFVSRLFMGNKDEKLHNRLTSNNIAPSASEQQSAQGGGVKEMMQKLGQAAAEPFMPKTREKQSGIRKTLGYAGIYAPNAIKAVTGAKVILLGAGLIGGYITGMMSGFMMMGLSLGGLVGYLVPTLWLKFSVKSNQTKLTLGLPDGLDLMVVCVEAGLTIDSAMQRVGHELAIAHPSLSRELAICHMETRVGLPRSEALKNLGSRTGNAGLQSLATMLTQAERFGTSIASALRIHAETLRINRQHQAEEMAAKASVKMSFPLVLFIFPATFIVLAGPTVIGLMNSSLF